MNLLARRRASAASRLCLALLLALDGGGLTDLLPGGWTLPDAVRRLLGEKGLGLFDVDIRVTILDLGTKHLPIEQDADDPDPKDVSFSRTTAPGGSDVPTKRLRMRAKRDDAAARLAYRREWSGDFSASIHLAITETEGLVDGASAGFFEVERPGSEGVLRMTATWDGASQGLTLGAADEGGALTAPVTLEGVREVFLQMTWNEDGRSLSASPLVLGSPAAEGLFFSHDDAVPRPDELFLVAFGVEHLGRKASVSFAELTLEGSLLNPTGGEVAPAYSTYLAVELLEQAQILVAPDYPGGPFPDLATAHLEAALPHLQDAQDELGLSLQEGDLHPTSETKRAGKSMKKASKRTAKAQKKGARLVAKGSDKTKSLNKRVNQALWAALLARAHLFGFRSKSIDHYFDTLAVDVDVTLFP